MVWHSARKKIVFIRRRLVPADSLWELANISLVMIGLSGVVAMLGRRMHGEWTTGDIKRLTLMLISGFRLMFAAALPLVFINFGLPEIGVDGI